MTRITGIRSTGDSNWRTGSNTQGRWEVWNGRKGDIARALLYMDVRYEGGMHTPTGSMEPDLVLTDNLTLIDQSNTGDLEPVAYMGMLSVLLQWHQQDPVDLIEYQHHEAVASFQGNRNPFIDHPEWVTCVFQNQCGCTTSTGRNALVGAREQAVCFVSDQIADLTPGQTMKQADSLETVRTLIPAIEALRGVEITQAEADALLETVLESDH